MELYKDAEEVSWRWEYFTPEEVRCKCGCNKMPTEFLLDKLTELRELINKHYEVEVGITLNSCARCAKHNKEVSYATLYQPHVRGLGADIKTFGKHLDLVLMYLRELGVKGIGLSAKNGSPMDSRYAHADWVDRGLDYIAWWSY